MPDWLDKAKDAAKKAADEAKKLAETAKNADYGDMLDKTKKMAMDAADEAKKAADNVMKKETPETKEDVVPDSSGEAKPEAQSKVTSTSSKEQVLQKISEVEKLLQDIKKLLNN